MNILLGISILIGIALIQEYQRECDEERRRAARDYNIAIQIYFDFKHLGTYGIMNGCIDMRTHEHVEWQDVQERSRLNKQWVLKHGYVPWNTGVKEIPEEAYKYFKFDKKTGDYVWLSGKEIR